MSCFVLLAGTIMPEGTLPKITARNGDCGMIASQSILTPPSGSQGKAGGSQSTKSSGGKRRREPSGGGGEAIEKLCGHVEKMAEALTSGMKTPMEKLGAKIFSLDGYERHVLKAAYKFLGKDLGEANNFIGLPEAFQREWLDEFIEEHM